MVVLADSSRPQAISQDCHPHGYDVSGDVIDLPREDLPVIDEEFVVAPAGFDGQRRAALLGRGDQIPVPYVGNVGVLAQQKTVKAALRIQPGSSGRPITGRDLRLVVLARGCARPAAGQQS